MPALPRPTITRPGRPFLLARTGRTSRSWPGSAGSEPDTAEVTALGGLACEP